MNSDPSRREICFDGKCPVKVTHYVGEAPGCQPPAPSPAPNWKDQFALGLVEKLEATEQKLDEAERRTAGAEALLHEACDMLSLIYSEAPFELAESLSSKVRLEIPELRDRISNHLHP